MKLYKHVVFADIWLPKLKKNQIQFVHVFGQAFSFSVYVKALIDITAFYLIGSVRFWCICEMAIIIKYFICFLQVSCMKFLNSLLKGCPTMNTRVFLQHELETAGFDIISMEQV